MENELPSYTTATAMQVLSQVCDLYHSSWQHQILNPLSEASSWMLVGFINRWATTGTVGFRISWGGGVQKKRGVSEMLDSLTVAFQEQRQMVNDMLWDLRGWIEGPRSHSKDSHQFSLLWSHRDKAEKKWTSKRGELQSWLWLTGRPCANY